MIKLFALFRILGRLATLIASILLATGSVSFVQAAPDSLFELKRAAISLAPHHAIDSRTDFKLDKLSLANLAKGQVLSVTLPDQRQVKTRVVRLNEAMKGVEDRHTVLSIEGGTGSVEIVHQSNGADQVRIVDSLGRIKLYEAVLDNDGNGELVKQNPDGRYCIDMPVAPPSPIQSASLALLQAAPALTENDLQQLQSKPASNKVIFINYWGGTLSSTAWNDQDNNGEDIVYSPYSRDGNADQFSAVELDLMWLGWREAAEDYAPFDVNITTDPNVYQTTPPNNRAMLIATTTSAWYGRGGGGVAFVGAYGNDYVSTGWVWNNSAGSLGQTISHEAGHIMGLHHDGTTTGDTYYSGHQSWGPIMGAPFNHTYVQWSKGEYPNANNTEDDLEIIAGVLSEDVDAIGDSTIAALQVSSSAQFEGVIEPQGLIGGMDTDVISFQLGAQQTVSIDIVPSLGGEAEQFGTNLSLDAVLSDGGTTIAQSNLSANPQTNNLHFNGVLNAGTYFLYISALTPDISWTTGFGEYANTGIYSVSIDSGVVEPDLISSFTPNATQLLVGQLLDVDVQIQNIGSMTADASIVRIYQSADNIISAADTQIAQRNINSLTASGVDSINQIISIPGTPGNYNYGVCVDSVANETTFANNCSAAVDITVSSTALDLDIGAAVEQPDPPWLIGGDAVFSRQTTSSFQGGDAAQSGSISDDQTSYTETEINGPGLLRFHWKVSSEENYDYMRFMDNGQEIEAISGNQDWVQVTYTLEEGVHRLRWQFDKDGSAAAGSDTAWLDKVEIVQREFEISMFDASQAEGDSGTVAYQYTVISNGEPTAAASVDYIVTAYANADSADSLDFGGTFPAGTLFFDANQTSNVITVWVSGDTDLEPDEIFQLTLSNPQGGILGANSVVQSIIVNDEPDVDRDGIKDMDDNCPAQANADQQDTDGDSIGNICDDDNDGDGIDDEEDNCPLEANPDQVDICTLCFPVSTPDGAVVMICL